MNKKIYLKFFFLIFFLSNCSFDSKTGIWSGSESEKKRVSDIEKEQQSIIEVIKIYKSHVLYEEEIVSKKSVKLTKPKKNLSWKMPGLNLQNFSGNNYLPGIEKIFLKKKIGKNKFSLSKVMSSPLILEEKIILSDDKGTIYTTSKQGKIYWKKNIYKKMYKKIYKKLTFTSHGESIYVADNIGFVYSINIDNGEIRWIKNHGIPFKSNIKIFDNKIILINQDNRVISFDTKSGEKVWDIRAVASFIKSQNFLGSAISKNGDLIVLNSSGDLIKVNATNGSIYWSLSTTESMLAHDTDFFRSSDVVLDKNNIIFSTANYTYSFNFDSGYINWKKKIGSNGTPIIDGDNVFFVSENGYFLNIDKKTGEIIWSTNVLKVLKRKKRNTFITGFILGSGKLYITTLNGYLIVCSGESGKTEYFKKIGGIINSPPIISNGALYILTRDSKILGFK